VQFALAAKFSSRAQKFDAIYFDISCHSKARQRQLPEAKPRGRLVTLIATATFLCNATPPQPLLRFSYFKLHQVHATEKVFHTRVRRQWLHPVQRYLGKTTWPITTLLRLARPYFELLMLNSWCSTPRTLYPFAATHPFRTQLQPHAHLSHKQHYK